jgi:hypothetical protein
MSLPLPSNAAGLGLRRGLIDELLAMPAGAIDFLEVSPTTGSASAVHTAPRCANSASATPDLPRPVAVAGRS